MMRKILATVVAAVVAGGIAYAGSSNVNYTSSGTAGFRTTTDGTTNCVGATACNLTNVTIWDSVAGTNGLAVTAGNAMKVDGTGGTFPATQSGAWTVNPTTIGQWGLTQFNANAAGPTNMLIPGAQFLSSPNTVLNGNVSPLQIDVNGNLKVNIAAGGAGGGTSSSFGAAFPGVGTAIGLTNGTNMVAWSATTTYGTAPAAIAVPAVNAFMTNGPVAQASTTSGQLGALTQCAVTTAAPTYTTAQTNPVSCDTAGNVRVNVTNTNANINNGDAISTGTFPAGSPVVGINYAFNGTSYDRLRDDANKNLLVAAQATTAGGSSTTGNIAPTGTAAVVVKASAGMLYSVQLYGIGSAPAYLKIYNATSATCGTGTPVKRLMIPAAATAANGAGSNITFNPGVFFSTGITYCVTTGITDADTTGPAASTFLINIDWL